MVLVASLLIRFVFFAMFMVPPFLPVVYLRQVSVPLQ